MLQMGAERLDSRGGPAAQAGEGELNKGKREGPLGGR